MTIGIRFPTTLAAWAEIERLRVEKDAWVEHDAKQGETFRAEVLRLQAELAAARAQIAAMQAEEKRLKEALYPADQHGWWCRGCAYEQNVRHQDWHDTTRGNECWVAGLGIRFVDVRSAALSSAEDAGARETER